jgi:hypothetical protein
VIEERLFHVRVVVPVVERGTAGKEIDIFATVFAQEETAARRMKDCGEAAAVAANFRLATLKN